MDFKKYLPWIAGAGFLTYLWIDDLKSKITYNIVGFRKSSLDWQGVVLEFIFDLNNKSTTRFTLISITGAIFFNNIELTKYYQSNLVESLPNTNVQLPIKVAVKWLTGLAALPSIIEALKEKGVLFDFKGNYQVKLFGMIFNIPYHYKIPLEL